jgi:hypothetical protein
VRLGLGLSLRDLEMYDLEYLGVLENSVAHSYTQNTKLRPSKICRVK